MVFAALVVTFATPNLHLDDVLCAEVVDNHVRARAVAGLRLDVIIACAIDNWTDIKHKKSATFFLLECQILAAVNIAEMLREFFEDFVHFERLAVDELTAVYAALVVKTAVDFLLSCEKIVEPSLYYPVGNLYLSIDVRYIIEHCSDGNMLVINVETRFVSTEQYFFQHFLHFRKIFQLFGQIVEESIFLFEQYFHRILQTIFVPTKILFINQLANPRHKERVA